jgi:ATP-binding cassette subfamily C protein
MRHKKTANNAYLGALRGLRGTFVLVGLFSAAINLLMLTGPIYMLQVYDRVLSSGSVATLLGLFGIVILLYSFLGLYDFLRARLLFRAALRLDSRVGDEAFRFALRAGSIGGRSRVDPRAQPVRDLELVRGFMSSPAATGLFDLPWMPLFLGLVFHSPLAGLADAGRGRDRGGGGAAQSGDGPEIDPPGDVDGRVRTQPCRSGPQ